MRRNNFWIGALVAVLTFVALSAFVGRRHWGWHRSWRNDRCNEQYWEDGRYHPNDRGHQQEKPPLKDTTDYQ